jgi:glycosyltransferase involved in cell wall biosynthesis
MDGDPGERSELKLAICAPGEMFGGVERQVLDLVSFWHRAEGVDPLVMLFHDGELARQLRARGVEPVLLRGRHRYDPALVGAAAAALDAAGCDVVHAHGYKATIVCGLAVRGSRRRLLKTEHGLPEWNARRPIAFLKSAANFLVDQYHTRRFVDEIAYVSDDTARRLGFWHRGLATGTIRNGIDPIEAAALVRPGELAPGRLNFGVVGRLTPVKGLPVAIRALARPEVPAHVHLVIVGTGEQAAELQGLAAELDVASRVHFTGFKANVYDYLAHLDAVLMPSYHEGLPYVLLEAMALGRPLLCSRVGGLAEALEDERTGLLVEAGEVAAWAAALARVAADEALRRRLGEAARDAQKRHYSLERMGGEYRARIRGLGHS